MNLETPKVRQLAFMYEIAVKSVVRYRLYNPEMTELARLVLVNHVKRQAAGKLPKSMTALGMVSRIPARKHL